MKHQPLNEHLLNGFIKKQELRSDSRKSKEPASAQGQKRRIESPEMFRNVANQSLAGQNKLNMTAKISPMRNPQKPPSRPISA